MAEGLGQHLMIEMYDCDERLLNDPSVIESTMLQTVSSTWCFAPASKPSVSFAIACGWSPAGW